jgi:hypothetical protein
MRHKLITILACSCALVAFACNIKAGPVDANGTALPDPNDGKSVVLDNSKEKVTPATVTSGCVAPADTEFRIGLPAWMAGLSGDFGVHGVVTDQNIDFTDVLRHLDMMASGSLYARYHRWEISADGLYLKLSETVPLRGILFESARGSVKQAFSEQFLGYRLINCESGFLSVFAGARYNYMSGELRLHGARLAGRRLSGETDWVDPVIGASGKVHLWKPVSFWAKSDMGGFGAASDFTWQVQGGLEIQATRWIYSAIGWRYLKNDYVFGGFTNKTTLNGPYLETGINF